MDTKLKYSVDHPGVFIREELEERGWLQADLAYILGCPVQAINLILSGKRGISVDMARSLEKAFDVPADFFLNLQKIYDLSRANEPDVGIAKKAKFFQSCYPIREMFKRGWLEDNGPDFLEAQMMRFFEVNSVNEIPHLAHAAKKTHYDDVLPNQLAWLFRVKQIAKSITVPAYSKKKLETSLSELKNLMKDPEEIRHVPKILMNAGVRFIIVEPLPGSKIDGVCFWLDNNVPVIGMSLRLDRIDNFWFVLRHEIEHVLLKHGLKQEVIDAELIENKGPVSEEERIANSAASEFCVPQIKLASFIARKSPYVSEMNIVSFALTLDVHPGIVVGQYQRKIDDFRYFKKYQVKIRDYLLSSALVDGWGNIPSVDL